MNRIYKTNQLFIIFFLIVSSVIYAMKSSSQNLFNNVDERIIDISDLDSFCSSENDFVQVNPPQLNRLRNITYFFDKQKVNFNIPINYKFIEFVQQGYNIFFIINRQDIQFTKCSFSQGVDIFEGFNLSYDSEDINDKILSLKQLDIEVQKIAMGKNKDIEGYKYYWSETGCFINYLIPLKKGHITINNHLNPNPENWLEECQNPSQLNAIEQITLDLFFQSLIIE